MLIGRIHVTRRHAEIIPRGQLHLARFEASFIMLAVM